jgi:hypothetical protein
MMGHGSIAAQPDREMHVGIGGRAAGIELKRDLLDLVVAHGTVAPARPVRRTAVADIAERPYGEQLGRRH